MSTWLALLKKEYRLTKSFVLFGLFLILTVSLLEVYVAYRYNTVAIIALSAILIMPHSLYLVVYMLRSLSQEWSNTAQLWLHLPQSGWTMLSAKLVSGFTAMFVSLGIASAFTFWIAKILISQNSTIQAAPLNWDVIIQYGLYLVIGLLLTSLYLGLWAMTLSVIVASLKRYIHRGRWLAAIALSFMASWLIDLFQTTALYEQITRWGVIHFPLTTAAPAEYLTVAYTPVYLGEALFHFAIMAGLFFLSGWLIDNKVEV